MLAPAFNIFMLIAGSTVQSPNVKEDASKWLFTIGATLRKAFSTQKFRYFIARHFSKFTGRNAHKVFYVRELNDLFFAIRWKPPRFI
jgi:hypothetical protein